LRRTRQTDHGRSDGKGSGSMAASTYPSRPSARVIASLEQFTRFCGTPNAIRCDSGPKHIGCTSQRWAEVNAIRLHCIQPDSTIGHMILLDDGTEQADAQLGRANPAFS